jgi:zinc transport system permease protein
VEGVKIERLRFVFLLLVAVVVALAMQIVGLLLAVSLLILPAATARRLVTTPEAMAAAAVAVGAISVLAGLWGSFTVDTPAGPSIVVAGTLLFAISLAIRPRG